MKIGTFYQVFCEEVAFFFLIVFWDVVCLGILFLFVIVKLKFEGEVLKGGLQGSLGEGGSLDKFGVFVRVACGVVGSFWFGCVVVGYFFFEFREAEGSGICFLGYIDWIC